MSVNKFISAAFMLLVVFYLLVLGIDTESHKGKTRFIPDSALVYLEQNDSLRVLQKFQQSPLGKNIGAIDFAEKARLVKAEETTIKMIEKTIRAYKNVLNDEVFIQLFGTSFALAYDSFSPVSEKVNIEQLIKLNTVLVSEPKYSANLITILAKNYDRFSEKVDISVRQYGNHHINRTRFKDENISFVAVDGLLLLSFNERLLRKCIDTYDGDRPALSSLPHYHKMIKKFVATESFVFLQVDETREYLNNAITTKSFQGKELLEKELATTKGFESLGYGMWSDKEVVTEQIVTFYNKHLVNTIASSVLDTKPETSSMLNLTTRNPAAYYWSNTFDLYHLLPYLLQEQNVSEQIKKVAEKIRICTGRSLTQILDWFGDEISLVIESGKENDFFSFPIGAMFIETKNAEELRATIVDLIQSSWVAPESRQYKDVYYNYLSIAPQEGLQLVYGFWDNHLFFANSDDLLHRVIDNHQAGQSLTDLEQTKDIDPGLNAQNNSVTYSSNVELLDMFMRALKFTSTMIAMEDRELAYTSRVIVSDVVIPLLEGLKMYDRSCTRSYFTSDFVIIKSKTHVSVGSTH